MEQTKQVSQNSLENAILELPFKEGIFDITMVVNELLFLNVGTKIKRYLEVCEKSNIIPFSLIKVRYKNEGIDYTSTSLILQSEDNNKLKKPLLKGGKIAMVLFEGRNSPLNELKKDLKTSRYNGYSIESGYFDFSTKRFSSSRYLHIDLDFIGGPKGKIEFCTPPNQDYYKKLYDWFNKIKK